MRQITPTLAILAITLAAGVAKADECGSLKDRLTGLAGRYDEGQAKVLFGDIAVSTCDDRSQMVKELGRLMAGVRTNTTTSPTSTCQLDPQPAFVSVPPTDVPDWDGAAGVLPPAGICPSGTFAVVLRTSDECNGPPRGYHPINPFPQEAYQSRALCNNWYALETAALASPASACAGGKITWYRVAGESSSNAAAIYCYGAKGSRKGNLNQMAAGINGINGHDGQKGEKGDRGPQGIQGPQGPKGDPGGTDPEALKRIQKKVDDANGKADEALKIAKSVKSTNGELPRFTLTAGYQFVYQKGPDAITGSLHEAFAELSFLHVGWERLQLAIGGSFGGDGTEFHSYSAYGKLGIVLSGDPNHRTSGSFRLNLFGGYAGATNTQIQLLHAGFGGVGGDLVLYGNDWFSVGLKANVAGGQAYWTEKDRLFVHRDAVAKVDAGAFLGVTW